ncbi:MAG: PAS domain-containing sensor histidine kinase [Bacteroidetes bacterium]|nr:PAS domain-containing sensor histidine kinase [Bacteroidota bacterium]
MAEANSHSFLLSTKSRFYAFVLNKKIETKSQYLLSVLIVWLVAGACYLFSGYIGSEVTAFILLLTLSVLAMFFDIFPVLLAALLSALIWDYFFLLPRFNLRVGNTEDKIMLSMYFVIALINGVLTFKIRQIEKAARRKEEKAKTLRLYNTLLNSLSHEFRTPLATIIGATDNLLLNPGAFSEEDQRRLLTEISIASLHLNQQVENLLNLSRLESGVIQLKKDWCDMNELVCDALRRLDEPLKAHTVQISIREYLPLFRLDYGLMEHVLYNLLYNAGLYTPPGSQILIKADWVGECMQLIVEDNGPGFPEEEITRVFDKFYRLKSSHTGGTGLGLSIVKGFVEAHNGTVVQRNSQPCGARFMITIPAEILLIKPATA